MITIVDYLPDVKRRIGQTWAARSRDAVNLLRRTTRLVVSQKAPVVGRRKSGRPVFAASAPGEVPFRRSGKLQDGIGFDFKAFRMGGLQNYVGNVSVTSYGWESGDAERGKGVKRPHLKPSGDRNRKLLMDVITGVRTAPRYGDTSFVQHRQKLVVSAGVSRKTGRGTQSVMFRPMDWKRRPERNKSPLRSILGR